MFSIFKKKSNEPNNELINNWISYCKDLGLNQNQILGLAYLNSTIPTVLSFIHKNDSIVKPLSEVVYEIGKISSSDANALYLYREFYLNSKSRDNSILPIELDKLPDNFFENNKKYSNQFESNTGMLLNSKLTLLLIQELGKILSDYKISIEYAFSLGHYHSNFFLTNPNTGLNYSQAIIICNILPQYIATAIEIIPNPNSLTLNKDIWLFSKILYSVLNDSVEDSELREWIWYYHNAIFYENKPNSTKIKSEWDLKDSNFEVNMIKEVMDTLPSYYSLNNNIGNQKRNIGESFAKWEDFFLLLNEKMKNEFELESPTTNFENQGELCNYLSFKFIATVKTIFEYKEI
jgi:hypothetical protein